MPSLCARAPGASHAPAPRERAATPTALTGRPGVAATPVRRSGYALLCENSFSTGTPTLCRAREAQSRWKNSST